MTHDLLQYLGVYLGVYSSDECWLLSHLSLDSTQLRPTIIFDFLFFDFSLIMSHLDLPFFDFSSFTLFDHAASVYPPPSASIFVVVSSLTIVAVSNHTRKPSNRDGDEQVCGWRREMVGWWW